MIDASALVAVLNGEPDAARLTAAISAAKSPATSPIAIYETATALMRENKWSSAVALQTIQELLDTASIAVAPITESTAAAALLAFERFGKGRHPAGLNMGDCFAYACARGMGAPLLYKGDDFVRTDILPA